MNEYMNWAQLSLAEQMVNIGTEVRRAMKAQKKGNDERMKNECLMAINMLALSISDEKNIFRRGELMLAQRVLLDYFFENNSFGSTEQQITNYYDVFIPLIA